jgi:hypothetical protein
MCRVMLVLATWMCLVPTAFAALSSRSQAPLLAGNFHPAVSAVISSRTETHLVERTEPGSGFNVTEQTEVFLNGQPCHYEDVPADASVVRMQVGADKKTVIRIHFRTRK